AIRHRIELLRPSQPAVERAPSHRDYQTRRGNVPTDLPDWQVWSDLSVRAAPSPAGFDLEFLPALLAGASDTVGKGAASSRLVHSSRRSNYRCFLKIELQETNYRMCVPFHRHRVYRFTVDK